MEFGCPWTIKGEHPQLDLVRQRALEWMERFGLAPDIRLNEEQYRRWLLAESAAWWHPDADADRLQIAADYLGWVFTPFDDVFDGPVGKDVASAARMCEEMAACLTLPDGETPRSRTPRVQAFSDLWQRSRRGRSRDWRDRAATHWRDYLAAQIAEVTNRVYGRTSTLCQLVIIKCVFPIFDMLEVVHDFEAPAPAWHTPLLHEIRQCCAEIITCTNDLVSADKEAAAGDGRNNLLLIAENVDGLTRPQAFERLRDMVHERYLRLRRLEPQIRDFDEILSPTERGDLRRYIDCLHNIVSGDNRWEHVSGRY
ncbi:terpene synthase family protein [Actinomadura rubrisoli]|uniref:Terpene synthase n=1 Tax=Actinomadura rubrisoli TaxID=2530368 RepID=A0A4R5A1H8_9ACTN|nr:hypothetical protein [Actinomadura rubrisoli]TDD65603.1 hypothetical protein E1298_41225 [Actinomadura rubrisoli]